MKFKLCKFKYLALRMKANALPMKNIITQIISTVNYSSIHMGDFYSIYVINQCSLCSSELQDAKMKTKYFMFIDLSQLFKYIELIEVRNYLDILQA